MRHPLLTARLFAAGALVLAVSFGPAGLVRAADTNTPAVAPLEKRAEETNTDTLRSYLQLQEQLHATQLALERNREEALEEAAKSSQLLTQRLQSIENSLAAQRARELEAMQASNRVMLIVAGSFAGVGFVAMLLMVFFQWRAVNRLAEISTALPSAHAYPALGPGETAVAQIGHADQANQRLLGALDRLEKRIQDLEGSTRPALKPVLDASAGPSTPESPDVAAEVVQTNGNKTLPPNGSTTSDLGRLALLLAKGQSLLNGDHASEALACFDEVLGIDPGNTEALVKKGSSLERLRRWDEAMGCYDRALAIDGSLTIAYLYKGGLFNRMERFSEALECYEKALHTQEKQGLHPEAVSTN
jgi:tetratricopeptide (TPR) repeat protein